MNRWDRTAGIPAAPTGKPDQGGGGRKWMGGRAELAYTGMGTAAASATTSQISSRVGWPDMGFLSSAPLKCRRRVEESHCCWLRSPFPQGWRKCSLPPSRPPAVIWQDQDPAIAISVLLEPWMFPYWSWDCSAAFNTIDHGPLLGRLAQDWAARHHHLLFHPAYKQEV